ncbi:MAG: hypothetical protein ACE5FP_08190, partial [Gemmatimonadota bacterium]
MTGPDVGSARAASRRDLAVFWVSVLGLYLELLLIRWIGTEIRIFAYLQNTVLVVCFLGLGVGLFTSRRPISLTRGLLSLTALAAGLSYPPTREALLSISENLSSLGEINIWAFGQAGTPAQLIVSVLAGLAMTCLVMVLVFEPFVPIGRLLGRLMDDHPSPIIAYSLNVAGSLVGVWAFVLLGRASQPPEIWFLTLLAMAAPFIMARKSQRVLASVCLAAVVILVATQRSGHESVERVWSPYQKLALLDARPMQTDFGVPLEYFLEVNNTGYQVLVDMDAKRAVRGTESDSSDVFTHYDVAPLLHPEPKNMLIVGAGAGNDAAAALRNGADRVTAVEIDPAIISIGERYHPQRPYSSNRVRLVLDDARSFLASTDDRFDLISFGLLDSHTATTMTNARLDHYVYTRE